MNMANDSLGAVMASEIAETPKVFRRILSNLDALEPIKDILSTNKISSVLILARGFAYPNAREAALKIQETCKVSVQGLSTADYLHGPISALTPQTQVFILAPAHLPLNSISEATTRIRAITGRIFWVGNGGSPEAGDIVIAGSDCRDEMESTIVDAISLQRFSLEFAKKSGFDPDAPVGLSKVTLTH